MTISEIQNYAREEARHIRTEIKKEFKEEHYMALIYNIVYMLEKVKE